MSIRPQTPDPGKKSGIQRWDYLPIPNGTKTQGWIAGPPTGVFVHRDGTDKPCRSKLTDGTLICPYCTIGKPVTWRGATPFYSPVYTRHWCWTTQDHKEYNDTLPHLAQIVLSRAKSKCAPVVIRAEVWRASPLPDSAERMRRMNLMDFLIGVLWDDADLQAFHFSNIVGEQHKPEPDEVPTAGTVPGPEGATPMVRAAWEKAVAESDARAKARDAKLKPVDVVHAAMAEPKPNGKHRKGE